MKRKSIIITMMFLSFVLIGSPLFSASLSEKRFDLGISLGPWFNGDVTYDNDDPGEIKAAKKTSFLMKAYADAYLAPAFSIGVYGHFVPTVSYKDSDAKQQMSEFGFSLKPRFIVNDTFAIKPGLGIGVRKYSSDNKGADGVTALGVNVSVEFQFLINNSTMFYIEPGFLGQPKGSNDIYDSITFPPMVYLMFGIAF
jgi:hypothetical protein